MHGAPARRLCMGDVSVGKLADFTVLSADIVKILEPESSVDQERDDAAFARCIADVQRGVGDGVEVELRHVGRQRELPLTVDRSRGLKRQVVLVVEIGFEQAAVRLRRTGDDGLQRAVIVVKADVVGRLQKIIFMLGAKHAQGLVVPLFDDREQVGAKRFIARNYLMTPREQTLRRVLR